MVRRSMDLIYRSAKANPIGDGSLEEGRGLTGHRAESHEVVEVVGHDDEPSQVLMMQYWRCKG